VTAWLGLVVGGAFGAVLRYVVSVSVARLVPARFPFGTLSVNITGALLIGALAGALAGGLVESGPDQLLWLALGVGFCGSYTTMSSWSLDSLRLGLDGRPGLIVVNFVLTFAGCLLAVMLGFLGGSHLVG
jgi:fluoride exporter